MNEYDYIARAAKKMEKERYKEVIDLCSKAIKINSAAVEAFDFRGNAKYELGEYTAAIEDFDKTIELEPNDDKHYYDRCWAYIKLEEYELAIMDINEAIELDKNNARYFFDKALIEDNLGRSIESIMNYTRCIKIEPSESAYIARGDLYAIEDMFDRALEDYNAAISLNPSSANAYIQRGLVYSCCERYRDAIKDFDMAIKLDSSSDDAYINRGKAKVELGLKDGLKDFNRAIKLNPENDDYYMFRLIARGKLYQREADLEALSKGMTATPPDYNIYCKEQAKQDIKDLNKALEIEPENEFLLKMRAERYYYLRSYPEALKDCISLAEINPKNEKYFFACGTVSYYMGKYKDAIDYYNKFLKMHNGKDINSVLFTKALSEYRLGYFNDVIETLNKAIATKDACGLYYYRALAKYNMKKYVDAYKDFAKATELKSDVEDKYKDKIPSLIKIFLKTSKTSEAPIGLSGIRK